MQLGVLRISSVCRTIFYSVIKYFWTLFPLWQATYIMPLGVMAKLRGHSPTLNAQFCCSFSSFSSRIIILSSPLNPTQTLLFKYCIQDRKFPQFCESLQATRFQSPTPLQLNTLIVLSSQHDRQSSFEPAFPLQSVRGPEPYSLSDFSLNHTTLVGLKAQQQTQSVPRSATKKISFSSEKTLL